MAYGMYRVRNRGNTTCLVLLQASETPNVASASPQYPTSLFYLDLCWRISRHDRHNFASLGVSYRTDAVVRTSTIFSILPYKDMQPFVYLSKYLQRLDSGIARRRIHTFKQVHILQVALLCNLVSTSELLCSGSGHPQCTTFLVIFIFLQKPEKTVVQLLNKSHRHDILNTERTPTTAAHKKGMCKREPTKMRFTRETTRIKVRWAEHGFFAQKGRRSFVCHPVFWERELAQPF